MADHEEPREVSAQERSRRAEGWERSADERERLADERESLADEREALADERDRLADRHDTAGDRREADLSSRDTLTRDLGASFEAEVAQAKLQRAESAARRANAELQRARQGTARVAARTARTQALRDRTEAAESAGDAIDEDERAWGRDRRDFVATEREALADAREDLADQRDETADLRERLADAREREALARDQDLDIRANGHYPGTQDAFMPELTFHVEQRLAAQRRRDRAGASRRAASRDRAAAGAVWGPQAYGPMLVASFADLAQQLFASEETGDGLTRVVNLVVDAVDDCDWASITVWHEGRVVDRLASHPSAAELDELQLTSGMGPGPQALETLGPVTASSLSPSQRWPALASKAAEVGAASCLCHGLFVREATRWTALGWLAMYSTTPSAFTEEDQGFASILAAFAAAAIAMANRHGEIDRREAALHRALSSRDVIGQAKGILMERQRLSAGDAFDLLRATSQRLNLKLTEVAEQLATTGQLP